MPTADQRLDQLEPIISEMLARLDETAAKVERVSAQLRQLTVTVTAAIAAQSDNIEYLLAKTTKLEQSQARLEQNQLALLKDMDQRFGQMDQRFGQMDQRFDQLFDYLKEKLK